MRNMLALVGAFMVTFGGLGWYLDWFHIRSTPAAAGHRGLNIDINTVKITEDLHRGSVKVQETLEKTKLDAEAKAKAGIEVKIDPAKIGLPEIKKPFFDDGGEAQEYPFDFRKPR